MKFFTRKRPKTTDESDLLQLGIMRQQLTANETNYLLGMTTQQEHDLTLRRLTEQLKELEDKHAGEDHTE